MSKLAINNLLTVEIPSYGEIHIHIDELGGLSTLKHKHIFSTVSKGIVVRFVCFLRSPSTTLCTVTCVLRFRTLSERVEVTGHDFVVLRGNILSACRLRCNRGKLVDMGHRIPDDAVEVITADYEMRFSHRLLESVHLGLCVRVRIERYRGNTHAGCFVDCKVHTHCVNLHLLQ